MRKIIKKFLLEMKNILTYYIVVIILYSPLYKIALRERTLKPALIILFFYAVLVNSGIKDRLFSRACPLLFDPLTPKKYRQ